MSTTPDPGSMLQPRSGKHGLVRVGILAGLAAIVMVATESPRTARWTSTSGLDVDIRSALRARSRSGMHAADLTSDLLLAGLGVTRAADWYVQREVYPALRSVYVDGSWLIVNEIANRATKVGAGRQRPYVGDAGSTPTTSRAATAATATTPASTAAILRGAPTW